MNRKQFRQLKRNDRINDNVDDVIDDHRHNCFSQKGPNKNKNITYKKETSIVHNQKVCLANAKNNFDAEKIKRKKKPTIKKKQKKCDQL